MAEETIAEPGAAAAPKEGSRLKFPIPLQIGRRKLIMLGAPVLLLAAGGGYLSMSGTVARLIHSNAKVDTKPKPLVFFDLPDFLVNLNSGGKRSNFLKLTVSLQIDNPEDRAQIQAVLPRIIDNCQIFLRELRVEDLRGASGIYRLREELLRRINAVSPVKVEDVLFKEMLVQ
ncbi:MAG: flagellar basal body-associated FliL family protein [Stellaceae bacterium]